MSYAKQNVKITKGKTFIKTSGGSTKTKVLKNSNGKRGNPNRCPTCGRFI
ncbi:MAG: hypothetical protein J6T10_22745 [Methanobrevibacter sp.]|nr:hypothetical protein [Methanobrevibacter sp.]